MRLVKCMYSFTKYTWRNVKVNRYLYIFLRIYVVMLCFQEIYIDPTKISEPKILVYIILKLLSVFVLVVPLCAVILYIILRTRYNGEFFCDIEKINIININRKISYPNVCVVHFVNEKSFIWIHYDSWKPKKNKFRRDYLVVPKYLFTSEQLDFIVDTLSNQLSSKKVKSL
jgi:hypothetical protein